MTTAKKLLQTLSICGLALSVIPTLLVFGGAIAKQTYLNLMLLGMSISIIPWVLTRSIPA